MHAPCVSGRYLSKRFSQAGCLTESRGARFQRAESGTTLTGTLETCPTWLVRFFASQLLQEPGAGERPVPVGGGAGNAQTLRGFFHGKTGEVAQLHQGGRFGIFG